MRILGRELALERLYWLVTFLIRVSLVVAAAGALFEMSWLVLFVIVLTFSSTFIPWLLRRRYNVVVPIEVELAIVLFVYASLFLGDIHGYYTRFWWWDLVLHAGSGAAFGLIGFLLVYMLVRGERLMAGPFLVALLSFSFALAIGALWEIVEFAIDAAFGTAMQRSGLVDTMWDLIVDALGALMAAAIGFFYVRGKKPKPLDRLLKSFADKNPSLFR